MVREDTAFAVGDDPLLEEHLPSVETANIQHWNPLIIAILMARVLSVTHGDQPVSDIDILPLYFANLVFAHGGCYSETDYPGHWNHLSRLVLEISDQIIELLLGGTAVALSSLANQAKPRKRHTSEPNFFWLDLDTVNSSRVGEEGANKREVYRKRSRTSALLCSLFPVFDQRETLKIFNSGSAE